MVMELIEGESLAQRIEKGALPLDQALKFAAQIADAIDPAHRAGVTHRDIKPQNIVLTRDGVKVLDFGLDKSTAKPLSEVPAPRPRFEPEVEELRQATVSKPNVINSGKLGSPHWTI